MGLAERKERERSLRVKDIMNAAHSLFIDRGYSNTTMLDIAEKSELSRRTIYHYFTSKEQISYSLMKESYLDMERVIDSAIEESHENGMEKLSALHKAFLKFYGEHYDELSFAHLLDDNLNLIGDDPPEEATECLVVIERLIHKIEEVFVLGTRDGSIRDLGKSPRELAHTTLVMIQSTLQKLYIQRKHQFGKTNLNDTDIIGTMFSIFFSAFSVPR